MSDNRPTDDLDARIASAKAADRSRGSSAAAPPAKGYGQGSRVLAMLLGSIVGGGVIGWAIDHWFGTSPWGLLVVLTLSVIGAFTNIIKMSKERPE